MPQLAERIANGVRRLRKHAKSLIHPARASTPVFVTGCHRSGTTMVMRVFDLSMQTMMYHTKDRRAYDDRGLVAADNINALTGRSRLAATVFKTLHQAGALPCLLDQIPRLRVVWLVRDHFDVVNSATRKWSSMPRTLQQIADDPQQAGWHGLGMSQAQVATLRKHLHLCDHPENAYAMHWLLRNASFIEQGLHEHPSVGMFRYESLVTNPHDTFRQMFEFCGLPYAAQSAREVHSSSVRKNNVPEIHPEIETLCTELATTLDGMLKDADEKRILPVELPQ